MTVDADIIMASVFRCPGGPEQGEEQLRRLALSLGVSTSGRATAVAKRCAQKIERQSVEDAARGWR